MKNRLFPSLSLLAVLLAACAPATRSTDPTTAATLPAIVPSLTVAAPTLEPATQPAVDAPTEAPAPTLILAATSRGPDLHATDPSTVSLASGQLQFVEFFRFT